MRAFCNTRGDFHLEKTEKAGPVPYNFLGRHSPPQFDATWKEVLKILGLRDASFGGFLLGEKEVNRTS